MGIGKTEECGREVYEDNAHVKRQQDSGEESCKSNRLD